MQPDEQAQLSAFAVEMTAGFRQVEAAGSALNPRRPAFPHPAGLGRPRGVRKAAGRPRKERAMSRYVDGFVVPVPMARLKDYIGLARKAGRVCGAEHGAIEYVECAADGS
jgi:hypothetical protein